MKSQKQLTVFISILILNVLFISFTNALNKSNSTNHNAINNSFSKHNSEILRKNSKDNKQKATRTTNALNNLSNFLSNKDTESKDSKLIEGWMSITSTALANPNYFPDLNTPSGSQRIYYDSNFSRLNPEYNIDSKEVPYPTAFYFKLNKNYLFYTSKKDSKTILSTMNLKSISEISLQVKNTGCINIVDYNEKNWVLCSDADEEALKFVCFIQKTLGYELERGCTSKSNLDNKVNKVEIRKVTQPLIIIPLPSKVCNSNWDYNKHGENWECNCQEGKEQSPINLPPKDSSVDTAFKPNFEYIIVDKDITASDKQMNISSGDTLKIRYENGSLKIKHPNMGRVVTPDGAVYQAKEIVFHSPSEHVINGARKDLEMQVIHYGITKGDVFKKVVLSFLFTSSPGALNKFFDKMNVYDLPNPLDKFREINDSLFIPYVFFKSEDDDMNILKPFSFFTYQGSMTTPPCEESVIHYVASEAIPLSNTSVTLMKEALRVPDMIDSQGNIQVDFNVYDNYRNTQDLNGRAVFHYDHNKYDCPELSNVSNNKDTDKSSGHYEKVTKEVERYFYVPGYEPSGLPNSILVTENEANNKV